MGILLAILAMISRGVGDFLIQKSTRKIGNWETLFFIAIFASVVLLPFIYQDIGSIFDSSRTFIILTSASVILFAASLLDFEALKRGKIAVVEPVWAAEIPISCFFAAWIIGEKVNFIQILLIIGLIAGLLLVTLKDIKFKSKMGIEKGVILGLIAALIMGIANFFIGRSARETGPLIINWYMNLIILIGAGSYLILKSKHGIIIDHIKQSRKAILGMCILDNIARIAFATSMSMSLISISVALSESYIIIAVILGIIINKEKLVLHQKIGIVLAVLSAVILAAISA